MLVASHWSEIFAFPFVVLFRFSSRGAFLLLSPDCPLCDKCRLGCVVSWAASLQFLPPWDNPFPCAFLCSPSCLRRYDALCSCCRFFCARFMVCRLICGMFDAAFLIVLVSCISLYCSPRYAFTTPHSISSFCPCGLSCIILVCSRGLLFNAARSSIAPPMYIMNISALIAYPWKTPILFPYDSPYLTLYFGAYLVPWCPLLMCLIVSSGILLLYNVGQSSSAPFNVSNSSDRPISSTLAFLPACSMYCDTFIIASVFEVPSLYPYWLLLVSMCVIFC